MNLSVLKSHKGYSSDVGRKTVASAFSSGLPISALDNEDSHIKRVQLELLGLQLQQAQLMLSKESYTHQMKEGDWAKVTALICQSLEVILSHATEIVYAEQSKPNVVAGLLTERQRDLLEMLAKGLGNKDIGLALNVSPSTISQMLSQMYRLLGVKSRMQAVAWFNSHGGRKSA